MWFCRKADYGTPPADYRLRLVGLGWGRNQYEIFGPDSRQPLDLRRSLRASNTVGRGNGERLGTSAASARRARCRSASAVRRRGASIAPLRRTTCINCINLLCDEVILSTVRGAARFCLCLQIGQFSSFCSNHSGPFFQMVGCRNSLVV